MIARLATLLVLAAAALGLLACGDEGGEAAAYDRGWIAAMIEHHEGAVAMSELAEKRADSDFVVEFAQNTIRAQTAEIALLRELDARLAAEGAEVDAIGGGDGGHAMTELDELKKADDFDKRFMSDMVVHHDGALAMVEELRERGQDPELAALADRISKVQKEEIRQMEQELGIKPREAVPGNDHGH